VANCETYLQQGVGLVTADIVTSRKHSLHVRLLEKFGSAAAPQCQDALYASAYRPVEREQQPSLDVWCESLAIGKPLPTLPLWLRGGLSLPVDLEVTYERTWLEGKLGDVGLSY
jgi:hypothetical protein